VQDKRFIIQAGESRVESDENIPAHEKRRLKIYADDDDVVVKVLGIPEADYECIMVNGSWPEKSLVEGDIVLCADGRIPQSGDIVLIEENGRVRLGILAEPGRLETKQGSRPIELSERIIGVGVALARKLSGGEIDFNL
jgi:hypothetical protein